MVLADLHTVADDAGRCRESGSGECVGDTVGCSLDVGWTVAVRRCNVGDNCIHALPGERLDGCVAADASQLPHRGTRQVVVRVAEPVATHSGELKVLRRSSAATLTKRSGRRNARFTVVDQRVEVASHTGGAQSET